MRLVTIQNKEVLDIINETGTYKVDPSKLAYQRLLPNYETMRDIMNENLKTNSDNLPIWCYLQLNGETPPLDLGCEDYYHKGTSGLNENVVLLELVVPDDQVFLTDYYSWTDYLFFTNEEPDEHDSKISLDNLHNYNLNDTVQATIFNITKDMIKSIHLLLSNNGNVL